MHDIHVLVAGMMVPIIATQEHISLSITIIIPFDADSIWSLMKWLIATKFCTWLDSYAYAHFVAI